MRVIGCDPGKNGAAVLYNGISFVVRKFHNKEVGEELKGLLQGDLRIMIERVHAFKMQGVTSCFTFGRMLGQAEGACQYAGYSKNILRVDPKVWQKYFGVVKVKSKKKLTNKEKYQIKKEHKNKLVAIARKYYPEADLGSADAILIAVYAYENIRP